MSAPQGSDSTLNIIISLADTLRHWFPSWSLVFGCSNARSPPFVCLANQPGHSRGDGSYPPRQRRKGDVLITMTLSYPICPPFPFILQFFTLIAAPFSFEFSLFISILPLAPFLSLAEKPLRTCQFLKPFGCILCVCLRVPAWWG